MCGIVNNLINDELIGGPLFPKYEFDIPEIKLTLINIINKRIV
jgi:hypothetical protein